MLLALWPAKLHLRMLHCNREGISSCPGEGRGKSVCAHNLKKASSSEFKPRMKRVINPAIDECGEELDLKAKIESTKAVSAGDGKRAVQRGAELRFSVETSTITGHFHAHYVEGE